MNVIRFEIWPGAPEDIRPRIPVDYFDEVRIFVDGRNFVDLVREVEAPFRAAEGWPGATSGYVGLRPKKVCPPSLHFLGQPSWSLYQRGTHNNVRIQLLQCECREPGCWPLFGRVKINLKTVYWRDFRNPHRVGKYGQKPWSYEALGPFKFNRRQYENALSKLSLASTS